MAQFDRFDIAEAHCVLEWDYNHGGWLQERPSNLRRMEASSVQLKRMQFRARPDLTFITLSENSQEIYLDKVLSWNLPRDSEQNQRIKSSYSPAWLRSEYPRVHADLYPGSLLVPREDHG